MKLVAPSAAELTLWREACAFLEFVPDGFTLPPRSVVVRWFVDSWGEHLPGGEVPLDARPPIPVALKAGRLRFEPEEAVLSTMFHEARHAHQVLRWPRLWERSKDEIERDAEDFASRAMDAWASHQAEWRQLLDRGRRAMVTRR